MGDTQVVLDAGPSVFSTALYTVRKSNAISLHPLVFPAYVAAASALTWAIGPLFSFGPLKKLAATPTEAPSADATGAGRGYRVKSHVKQSGGNTIFVFKSVRLLTVLAILGLQVASLVQDEEHRAGMSKHWGKKDMHPEHVGDTKPEWINFILSMTYLYASFLGFLSVAAAYRRATSAARHLTVVLLSAFAVYAYRDLWPLATFILTPLDEREGPLLWARIAVLGIASILIPLTIPRKYIPHDPQDPFLEPNLEQTAPILSMALYTFLDPIVFLANRVSHLTHDQLPPLADYDHAKNLVQRSFKHLDVFSGGPKRHLFFGFMKVFMREYIALTFLISLKVGVLTGFFGPVGINRLLAYLETDGEGAVVRPWVWISCLLLGPLVGSLAMQWYTFIATGVLVRVEAIITQLVFEHALRIRMKAETPSRGTSTANTPDNWSEASSSELESETIYEPGHSVEDASNESGDDTLRASTPSVRSSTAKGKGKAKAPDAKTPEPEAEKQESNLVGKINNLVSTDLSNITDGRDFLLLILYMPFQLALSIWFLYAMLGWSAFVGMAVMVMLFPVPGYVAKMMQTVQQETMSKTDARVQTVTETMGVLRMIKLFGWEPKIDDKIAEKRDLELKCVKKRQLLNLFNGTLKYMIATFAVYVTSIVFSSMAVFEIMRDQLHSIFYMIPMFIQAKVSLDRVDEFLHKTELLDEFARPGEDAAHSMLADASRFDEDLVGFENASFTWSTADANDPTPSRKFTLRIDDQLLFKGGAINLITGPTGSGKTSLLMALLGEMHFVPLGPGSRYHRPRKGGVAYAAQESWVQNETIRDNILFGAPYDEDRYEKVVLQCGLKRDFSLFEAGDRTEVGEKGLTLRCEQNLSRAIYSSAETLLLDDVLAALDVHTSRWIVDKCFKGDLIRGRTVLLVTHNVAMVSPIAEYVVSLGRDGTIASRGSVFEALAKSLFLQEELAEEIQEVQTDDREINAQSPDKPVKHADGKLILAEEVAEGHVSWDSLKLFLSALGGSHAISFWVLFFGGILLCDVARSVQTWWMGYWAEQYNLVVDPSEVNIAYYLAIFCLFSGMGILVYSGGSAIYVFGTLRASKSIHRRLVRSVLGATLRWLATTPTSRVIARCTQDIRALDGPVANNFVWLVEYSVSMLIKLGAVVVLTPVFLVPGVLVFALGGWCGQIYMRAQIAVKREMSNARAPVLGHFGAAIAGLTSIRAYGAQVPFRTESYKRIDRYTRAARTFYNLNRWISLRIDILGGVFTSALGSWLIYGPKGSTALPSNTGFSLTMAVGFSGMILWWVRILNDFEIQGNSLERILGYIKIEQEPKFTKDGVPPAYWPASGDLRVEKLSARYSEDGPKVLHDVSFHIHSGERVGVVGRTGSGKSSLTLSLLRCIFTEGMVYYDGIPTYSINLEALRSNITIIPQMPELLSGTLRENLDPFDQYDDATLNSALRAAGLFSLQAEDDNSRVTLDSAISLGGGDLSVGQRQIIALARAIVRGSKLLILDEATSAIDYKTDAIIQSSLRNELKGDVTLITIAHRLQTIMDADKIMVLDAGSIVEFGRPSKLLKVEDGCLRSLVDESGDKEVLYAMASSHEHAMALVGHAQSS
ncbi:hypothetical protein FA95DRAFT_1579668 [Auriscalpium vulgare]|uniref:Uncharacterized protein n=1 Tax=Auriscalpium vulgare TaxID=40419 RepID=A0ACB8SAH9_9AGAM|nr:hypothetical protein FA95DRAFT_1579668 [Auriscalpium vulgare]